MTTPLTRRGFLVSASAFAATALAACGGGGVSSLVGGGGGGTDLPLALETDPNRRLARVERRHFEPLVGASFRLASEGSDGAVNVQLTELVDLGATNPDAQAMGLREPFSLKLRGPEGRLAADGPHVLAHPEIGDVHVFVRFGGAVDEVDANGERTLRNAYRIHFS